MIITFNKLKKKTQGVAPMSLANIKIAIRVFEAVGIIP
jgi:hypothetical protein